MLTSYFKGRGWLCPEPSLQGTCRPQCSWCRRAVQGLSMWPCQLGCRTCFQELMVLKEEETPTFLGTFPGLAHSEQISVSLCEAHV